MLGAEFSDRQKADLDNPVTAYKQLFQITRGDRVPPFVRKIDFRNPPKPDFPHSLHHVETVRNLCGVMVNICGLDDIWRNAVDIAAKNHDISQGYTTKQKVPIGHHAEASSLISYMKTGNIRASDIINNHDRDILGTSLTFNETQDTARGILRDADRLAHSGYSGLIRAAYYWGFRHKLMDSSEETVLQSMVLCDPRCENDGLPNNHEQNVRKFVLKELFPFLIKTHQVDRAIHHTRTNIERFFGSKRPNENLLDQLTDESSTVEKVAKGKLKISNIRKRGFTIGNIDKIDRRYAHLFILKPLHDYVILDTCMRILHIQTDYWHRSAVERHIRGILLDNDSQPNDLIPYTD